MKLLFLLWTLTGAFCYMPLVKDSILSNIFLRDLVNRINGKTVSEGDGVSYLDFTDGGDGIPLNGRPLSRELEEEQMFPMDYDGMGPLNIRDQEYLQHSSIWAKQFDNGDSQPLLRPPGLKNKQDLKSDSTLPAYCNPPNPCPLGYSEQQGCIVDFENSASYSRQYQSAQDCMCDTEHMFECPNPGGSMMDDPLDPLGNMELNRFLTNSIKIYPHKNLVAKKYHIEKESMTNPFLAGEKLPIAAKKGHDVIV